MMTPGFPMKSVIATSFVFSFVKAFQGVNIVNKDGNAASIKEDGSLSTLHINAQAHAGESRKLIRKENKHASQSQGQEYLKSSSMVRRLPHARPVDEWYPGKAAAGGHVGDPQYIVVDDFQTANMNGNYFLVGPNDLPDGIKMPVPPPYMSDTHLLYFAQDGSGQGGGNVWKITTKDKMAQVLGAGPQDANAWTLSFCDITRETCSQWMEWLNMELKDESGTWKFSHERPKAKWSAHVTPGKSWPT